MDLRSNGDRAECENALEADCSEDVKVKGLADVDAGSARSSAIRSGVANGELALLMDAPQLLAPTSRGWTLRLSRLRCVPGACLLCW